MLPEPGRPRALSSDLDDAEHLLTVTVGLARMTNRPAARARVLREALWFLWEQPRLPRPLLRSKYPNAYPWSPAAIARVRSGQSGGLVLEHLEPRVLLVSDLLARADEWTPATFAAELHRRAGAAVVTQEDDRRLTSAGFARAMPETSDGPWARYVASGIDVAAFRSLSSASPVE
ncbi:hypothetical protein [Curtobacterium sp. MCPF17_031]|uniref:hypothetical protein n=1 Tax=Curtobacterium sp. MCPF17_031 TaxID=2175653 RepID=UPI000DA9FF39|nr:hypothetical protein [Curtobacterium sp. MCPF17_031]PZE33929.1 hypothetical protein DEJ31_15935 [Curtobacterium sp. MCPF17_031]